MKLANIEANGGSHATILVGDEVVDMTVELGAELDDVGKLLAMGAEASALAARCIKAAKSRLPRSEVTFCAPVLRPEKIIGVGMNYHSFMRAAQRLKLPLPAKLIWFYRPRSCLTGPYGDIWLPRRPCQLEYEGELAVIIGRHCRDIGADEARAAIAGFTIANDATLREKIFESLVLAKSFPTHTPLGPWIVTPDEIGDPHQLALRTWVNGELRQDSTTADMVVGCYELVAELSKVCTLAPGDVILTGTPDGTGLFQTPPSALKTADLIKIAIEGIGAIENRVIEAPPFEQGHDDDISL